MTAKTIVITGAAGQDGKILGLKLTRQGHRVLGIVRSQAQIQALNAYNPQVDAQILDSSSEDSVTKFLVSESPDQIYHLSAKSSVADSWTDSRLTLETNLFHTLNWLNGLKKLKMFETRFYHASTSEMFGTPKAYPQNEETLLHPRSPYGVSKVAAHHLVVNYRESFGQFACSGILFNHESPLRPSNFVTRKITQGVARIALGLQDTLELGNLDVSRDWGWAPDFVDGMIKVLNNNQPEDFVLSSEKSHTLNEFVDSAFRCAGIVNWNILVKINPALLRPADVFSLVGDSSKAKQHLHWETTKPFQDIIQEMVQHDLAEIKNPRSVLQWRDF